MEKTALQVLIKPENRLPPFIIGFPEQPLHEKLAMEQFSDRREGWSYGGYGFCGKDTYMRYVQYHVTSPTTFYSMPIEPVVTLHVQIHHEGYFAFTDGKEGQKLWPEDRCSVFWQGDQVLEHHLLPGKHTQLDLFFRPEAFKSKVNAETWQGLFHEMDSLPFGGLDGYPFTAGMPLEEFFFDLFEELMDKRGKPTVERFQYLMDCLLPLAMGEAVEVEPRPPVPPEAEGHPQLPVEKHHEPSEQEQEILSRIADLDRAALEWEFSGSKTELDRFTESAAREREEAETLRLRHAEAIARSVDDLADAFLDVARRFADHLEAQAWTEGQQARLKRAILTACDNAFDFRAPAQAELDFYGKWGAGPRLLAGPTSLGLKEFSQLLGGLQGVNQVDYTGVDDTPEGRALFEEKMREQFGFSHMSQFTGETEKDKPVEVVRLYHHLMTELADSMGLDDERGPSRSDAIRLLDHAYEYNDYLALLRLELKYLGNDPGYIARQDDGKLRWYIVAMQCAFVEAGMEQQRFRDTDYYYLLELYRGMGGDEAAFTELCKDCTARYKDWIDMVHWVCGALSDKKLTKRQVLDVAAIMKRIGEEDDVN